MRAKELLIGVVATLAFTTTAGAQQISMASLLDAGAVEVWMDHLEYRPFEKAEVGFAGPAGSYLLVLRVGDDGYNVRGTTTVEILYPRPMRSTALTADQANALSTTFKLKGGPGTGGQVFAFASSTPYNLSKARQTFRWADLGRPMDPRGKLEDIAAAVVQSFGIKASDILGVSEDDYTVVSRYGRRIENPFNSYYNGSYVDRRCADGMVDSRCNR
jgi:hypothetical protein